MNRMVMTLYSFQQTNLFTLIIVCVNFDAMMVGMEKDFMMILSGISMTYVLELQMG